MAFCESVPRWFPEPPVTPRPPRFRAPEPLLDAPVGVPIKCPACPRCPPKPRLPDPFQGFQGTRLTNPRRPHPPFRTRRTQPPRTLADPIPLVPCLGSAPSTAALALSGVNRPTRPPRTLADPIPCPRFRPRMFWCRSLFLSWVRSGSLPFASLSCRDLRLPGCW